MNIAITGHTSGIGKAIADLFESHGHVVIGFSRSTTGHDLLKPGIAANIAKSCTSNIDIFINNAFAGMAQVDILYQLYDMWKDQPKIILNISSNASDGIQKYRQPYAIYKSALDKAVEQLQYINPEPVCRILNLRPGYVDTPMVKDIIAPKLSPQYVAEVAKWMIEQPKLIRNLTITP